MYCMYLHYCPECVESFYLKLHRWIKDQHVSLHTVISFNIQMVNAQQEVENADYHIIGLFFGYRNQSIFHFTVIAHFHF